MHYKYKTAIAIVEPPMRMVNNTTAMRAKRIMTSPLRYNLFSRGLMLELHRGNGIFQFR
jgi:hypothetical protein